METAVAPVVDAEPPPRPPPRPPPLSVAAAAASQADAESTVGGGSRQAGRARGPRGPRGNDPVAFELRRPSGEQRRP
eukprot:6920648-Alexandrium_andersonii.AAC.1